MSDTKTKLPDLYFMKGTENSPDFLVVAQNGLITLGIKPMLSNLGPGGLVPQLRLRSTYCEKTLKPGKVVEAAGGKNCATAWPDIPFDKVEENTRASVVVGTLVDVHGMLGEASFQALEESGAFRELCKWVMRRVPEQYAVVTPDQMYDFVRSVIGVLLRPEEASDKAPKMLSPVDSVTTVSDIVKEHVKKMQDSGAFKPYPKAYAEKNVVETKADGMGGSNEEALHSSIGQVIGGGTKEGKSFLDELFSKIDSTTDKGIRDQIVGLFGKANITLNDPDQMVATYKAWKSKTQVPGAAPQNAEGGNVVSLWGDKAWDAPKAQEEPPEEAEADAEGETPGLWDVFLGKYGGTELGHAMTTLRETHGNHEPNYLISLIGFMLDQTSGTEVVKKHYKAPQDPIDFQAAAEQVDELDTADLKECADEPGWGWIVPAASAYIQSVEASHAFDEAGFED